MTSRKKVLAISGSTRKNSSNLQIIKAIKNMAAEKLNIEVYEDLASLPHFNPDLDHDPVPEPVITLRNKIKDADGVLICTPEYVFSLPGSLKNAIEWMVSTTLFSEKPVALITASGLGEKAHESLQLIMKTIYADFNEATQLHISGARAKVTSDGTITDEPTLRKIKALIEAFVQRLNGENPGREM
jgi:chromate reductase